MVLLVRLYAHYAGAPFLHKFAQTVPSTDRMALLVFYENCIYFIGVV